MKGLRAEIYRSNYRCDLNLLDKVQYVTVIGLGKDAEIFEPTPDAPAVKIVRRKMGREEVVHLEPVDQPKGLVGPMAGGSFVSTSDGRFGRAIGFYGAVALHDRFEAQYDALSR